MALSNAEKVRRYRERQKAKKQKELTEPSAPSDLFQTPFFQFFTEDDQLGSQYMQSLELAGIEPLMFEDDSGPESTTLDDFSGPDAPESITNAFGESVGSSHGKAEVMIGCLLASATDLAHWVNDYKKAEIRKRIAEIEARDLTEPATKRTAFAEVKRLNKMLDQLDKQVRWTFPQWKVTG